MQSAGQSGVLAAGIHQLRLFFIALQFFTRLPVPRWVGFDPQWLHQASRYFPAVGIVVGAVAAATYALAAMLWPVPVAALLSTAATIYMTGAFHEDGFADVCDGFGGGMAPERVLEIMKDSRVGAYGAIGIAMLLALKCVTLSLFMPRWAVGAMLAAHPVSRLCAASLIRFLDYARAEGKAKPLAQHMSTGEFVIAAATVAPVLAAAGSLGLLPWKALAAGMAASACATAWLARYFHRRIGGYTGDCLGAVQQVSEAGFYLTVLSFAG